MHGERARQIHVARKRDPVLWCEMRGQRFTDAGFFIVRVPLLPVDAYLELTRHIEGDRVSGAASAEPAWQALLARPDVSSAISLQSPSLWAAVERAVGAGERLSESRVTAALYRFLGRAATRCTPRGLFAAVGIGQIGDRTGLEMGGEDHVRVRVDISLDYLGALLHHLRHSVDAYSGVRFKLNPTLIRHGDTVSLRETFDVGPQRGVRLVRLEASPLLQQLLDGFRHRDLTASQVRKVLARRHVPLDQRDARIAELLRSQLLVPAIGVCAVTADPVRDMIRQLPRVGPLGLARKALESVQSRCRRSYGERRSFSLERLEKWRELLPAVPGFEDVNRAFQVDTHFSGEKFSLRRSLVARLSPAINLMHSVFGDLGTERLAAFKEAFLDRFGESTVPLLRVLDPELGIGASLHAAPASTRWPLRGRRAAMLRLVHDAYERGVQEADLDQQFLDALEQQALPELPSTFSVLCSVLSDSDAAVDRGACEIVLHGILGNTGTELWARHSRAADSFATACRTLRSRTRPDADGPVRADVAFTPLSGADIAVRPPLEQVRIECGASSARGKLTVLGPADLHVQVRNDKVRIVSRQLGREVHPVIGTSLDPSTTDSPVFLFLHLIAGQESATPLVWEWGELAESPFLPRIRFGKVILSPARWRIGPRDLQSIRQRRVEARLPQWVGIRSGEDKVPCDLDHPLGIRLLEMEVVRAGHAVLEDMPLISGRLCVRDGQQRFAHELVLPLLRSPAVASAPAASPLRASPQPRRWLSKFSDGTMLPGGEWVYAKLYASPLRIQAMLRREVAELIRQLRSECGIKQWFFFRYKDSDWHLRLRVRVPSPSALGQVQDLIGRAAAGLHAVEGIWRLQYDTYYRELERFGGPAGCAAAEALFCVESDLALAAFEAGNDDESCIHERLQLATGWILWTWSRLGLDTPGMCELAHRLQESRGHLPHATERIVPSAVSAEDGAWRLHCRKAGKALDTLRRMATRDQLGVPLAELGGDLAHMFANRLFATRIDERERAMYASVSRHLRSVSAKS